MRCGTGDPVVFGASFLAVADDVLLECDAGLSARALQVPVDGDFVARDDAAPVGAQQDVVDGRASGLNTAARQRLAGIGIEDERDYPRRHVVAALAATPVKGARLGEAVADLDAVDPEEGLDD